MANGGGLGISDVRELKYTFLKKRKFFESGKYNLYVEQAMRYGPKNRIDNLNHILDVGLIIEESNE